MTEFVNTNELKGAQIVQCDMSGATIRGVNFSNVKISDAWVFNTEISGAIGGLKINGVEVEPLVEAELDRRHPERTKLRPDDIAGVLAAFDVVDEMWAPTIERARALGEDALHERVDAEYSFVETLRHLLFATDAWLTRIVLQVPNAYHEFALPPDLMPDAPPDTGPRLDEVLPVRAERFNRLREWLSTAIESALLVPAPAPDSSGFPGGSHRAIDCFRLVFREEWWHHQYAIRDLAVLEQR